MAIYTYVSNKNAASPISRLTFSTGKDILIGESLDLTAGEITELGKLSNLVNVQAGTVAAPITYLTFPRFIRYLRGANGVAVPTKRW